MSKVIVISLMLAALTACDIDAAAQGPKTNFDPYTSGAGPNITWTPGDARGPQAPLVAAPPAAR